MVTSSQQRADATLATWQQFRNLTPAERLRKIDESEAQLRAVAREMADAS